MSIIIKPGERGSQKRERSEHGFTLPEVLISLCILMLLLQLVWQWGFLALQTEQRMQQNRQAVWLAEAALAELPVHLPEGWIVDVDRQPGAVLVERQITVSCDGQQWQFYYAGKPMERTDEQNQEQNQEQNLEQK